MKTWKKLAIAAGLIAVLIGGTFAATISWAMTHVEVWETPRGVELVLGDNVWLHNER